jgi:hypothetical protein
MAQAWRGTAQTGGFEAKDLGPDLGSVRVPVRSHLRLRFPRDILSAVWAHTRTFPLVSLSIQSGKVVANRTPSAPREDMGYCTLHSEEHEGAFTYHMFTHPLAMPLYRRCRSGHGSGRGRHPARRRAAMASYAR